MIRERLLPSTNAAINEALPFVDMTICPEYSVAYKDALLEIYGLDKYMYRYKGVYLNITGSQVNDPQVIYDSITHDVDEIISAMTFHTANGPVDGVKIEFNKTKNYDDIKITTSHWMEFGRCYSIRPNAHLLEQSIQMIDIFSRIDDYIYFGYPGQTMHPNTMTKVI